MSTAKNPLLSCAEALEIVRRVGAEAPLPAEETVSLDDALGRVLAQKVAADRDQPPFPRSTRDGYAVRAADIHQDALLPGMVEGKRSLQVIGAIRAGERWTGAALGTGEAVEIMTGAPVPEGADAVLMLEHASHIAGSLQVRKVLRCGENIVPQGAEARAGQELLQPGTRMGPAEIALAASVGAARLRVYKRPVVAILSTGDELVGVDETPGPQQIRNSNAHALAALVRQSGGELRVLPIAADTREALEQAVNDARGAAMLVLSGGVSAGKYDLVEPVLLSRGASFFFTGVAMQPGKPAVFGSIRDGERTQWIFGLPGNPVSTQVTAMLFALPMLRALKGERDAAPVFVAALLSEGVSVKPGLTRFLPARLSSSLQAVIVTPTGWQGSGDLHSNARANCYLVVPPDVERLETGAAVRVLLR